MSKLNIPSYSALIPRDKQIKSIIDLYENALTEESLKVSATSKNVTPEEAMAANLDYSFESWIAQNYISGLSLTDAIYDLNIVAEGNIAIMYDPYNAYDWYIFNKTKNTYTMVPNDTGGNFEWEGDYYYTYSCDVGDEIEIVQVFDLNDPSESSNLPLENILYYKGGVVTSSTSGLKLEVVDEMPENPDDNTVYIVR